jgi:hypothetical protein
MNRSDAPCVRLGEMGIAMIGCDSVCLDQCALNILDRSRSSLEVIYNSI